MIYYDVSEDVLMERCLARAAASKVKREDDNPETLMNRLRAFNEKSKLVVELYQEFGKVHYIYANESIDQIFEKTKRAILPQVFFLIGSKCSGKTTLGSALAERTNMSLLSFNQFLTDKNLKNKSDEAITMALIKHLVNVTASRVLIEDFPQNETQAKLFLKNCIPPTNVFYLKCTKDTCQARMLEWGKNHPDYIASGLLSKLIKEFNDSSMKLVPFLKSNTSFHEIDTEQPFDISFRQMCKIVEPVVILLRSPSEDYTLNRSYWSKLQGYGFKYCNPKYLIDHEMQRFTALGLKFMRNLS